MRFASVALAAAIGTLIAQASAFAVEVVSIRSKIVEISADVDDGLKPYPGLFNILRGEARLWAAAKQTETRRGRRETPMAFRDGQPWTFERAYDLRTVAGPFVSVVEQEGFYTGGAHPVQIVDTILWDRNTRKRVKPTILFKDTADNGATLTALAKLAQAALVADKKARDIPVDPDLAKDMWVHAIKPTWARIGAISLAPSTEADKSSGLTFHFSPAYVGPSVDGEYALFVPWTEFRQYLSPQGMAIFGGERPASDKEP